MDYSECVDAKQIFKSGKYKRVACYGMRLSQCSFRQADANLKLDLTLQLSPFL